MSTNRTTDDVHDRDVLFGHPGDTVLGDGNDALVADGNNETLIGDDRAPR